MQSGSNTSQNDQKRFFLILDGSTKSAFLSLEVIFWNISAKLMPELQKPKFIIIEKIY